MVAAPAHPFAPRPFHSTAAPQSTYSDAMYAAWRENPASVHKSWADAFSKLAPTDVAAMTEPVSVEGGSSSGGSSASLSSEEQNAYMRVQSLIRAYRVRGHQGAALDPLGIALSSGRNYGDGTAPELQPQYFGFTDADLDTVFHLGQGPKSYRSLIPENPSPTLREIYAKLQARELVLLGVL
jgi:2-oxoglutarate dehydrogenase E1 component